MVRNSTSLRVLLVPVFVAALFASAEPASASNCSVGSCGAGECQINCPTSQADYLVFGDIWTWTTADGWIHRGVGVCQFQSDGSWSKGSYVTYAASLTDTAKWVVRADGADDSSGGNDLVRLANTSGEYCKDTSSDDVWIDGTIPAADDYLFWGDGGSDKLYLCRSSGPTDCIANDACADGRAGNDYVYGTSYADELYGAGGGDVFYGYGGADTLYGGDGDDIFYGGDDGDTVWCGAGDDFGYGDGGDDTLIGETGCDYLEGNAHDGDTEADNCYCAGNGIDPPYCPANWYDRGQTDGSCTDHCCGELCWSR